MTGGLTQLTAVGTQNYFLNARPKRTFFKDEVETHTHFAMESKSVYFNRTDVNISASTRLTCKIPRHGDLLLDMHLCFELPPLYFDATNGARPKWVKEVGHQLIDNVSIVLGGNVIEKTYGEWMSVYSSMTLPLGKQHLYNAMVENTVDMFDPDILTNDIDASKPFVKGRLLMVPLMFWFSREPGCALPLVSLQYEPIIVNVELKPLQDVYLVNARGMGYQRPVQSNPAQAFSNFYAKKTTQNSVEINPYLEVNYVFLDEPERDRFVTESQDYLINQLRRIEKSQVSGAVALDLVLQNPVKELIFFARDARSVATNDALNMTNFDDGSDIIRTVKILFNGFERLGEKPIEYFKYIQNFRHHTGSPRPGIYAYSFSLAPEMFQPSGECNMSKINSVQLLVKTAPNVVCDVVIYAVNYNFLRMAGGMAGVAFAV